MASGQSGLGLATCGFRCCLEAKRVRDKMIDFRNVKLQESGGDEHVGINTKAICARQRSPRSAGSGLFRPEEREIVHHNF